MHLVFDTETTGLPLWREPSEHPRQPHVVQLAMIVLGDDLAEIEAQNILVRPDGWTIPAEATAIHGISTERAMDEGVPAADMFAAFEAVASKAGCIAAHNINFDARMMRIVALKLGREDCLEELRGSFFCTMNKASPIVALPPTDKMLAAGFTKRKPPNLGECIRHFFGEALDGAHDAMVDARACARLYRELRGREVRL